MKKTPIFLAILTLATGVNGLANAVLAQATEAGGVPDVVPIQAAGTGGVPNILVEGINQTSKYFRIERMDFEKNSLFYGVSGAMIEGGLRPQTVLVVARDFEAGVSEAEAEAKLPTLGVSSEVWYKKIADDKLPAFENEVKPRAITLKGNLPDVLYFAMHYGRATTDAEGKPTLADEYWVRGKVDYRRCRHSALFDSATMYCTTKVNSADKTAEIAAMGPKGYVLFPEDERVINWEEEWTAELRKRVAERDRRLNIYLAALGEQQATITNLQRELNTATTGVEQKQIELTKAKADLAETETKLSGVQTELTGAKGQLSEAQVELARARLQVGQILASKTEIERKMADLQTINQSLQAKNQELSVKNAELATENEVLRAQIRALEAQLAVKPSDTAGRENGTQGEPLSGQIGASQSGGTQHKAVTDGATTWMAAGVATGVIEATPEEVKQAEPTEAPIEVPNLGKVGAKANLWWTVTALGGAILALGLGCKRKLER